MEFLTRGYGISYERVNIAHVKILKTRNRIPLLSGNLRINGILGPGDEKLALERV
jgi:hypothetical protein